MARPRSEDKRNAILVAATQVIAEQGESAPTARIAKVAGVAEGTLFTYFSNKDELLNQLYLQLKEEVREAMMLAYPRAESVKNRSRHVWQSYVDWGVREPQKRKALAQLGMSERVTPHSKSVGMQAFAEISTMMQESIAKGLLRDHPPAFVSAIMSSLAETTMDFMARDPAEAARYRTSGFNAFWNAIAHP
ncbi:MAG: TetR family transcriptional regulator [Rhizobacter sp.]|nr:TetR family transcriptional regulator [Rhizobacter sp.]